MTEMVPSCAFAAQISSIRRDVETLGHRGPRRDDGGVPAGSGPTPAALGRAPGSGPPGGAARFPPRRCRWHRPRPAVTRSRIVIVAELTFEVTMRLPSLDTKIMCGPILAGAEDQIDLCGSQDRIGPRLCNTFGCGTTACRPRRKVRPCGPLDGP